MKKPIPEVAVVIDTSGSIGSKELNAAVAEIKGILKTLTKDIRLIICDAYIHSNTKVRSIPEVLSKITGGGGTDMRLAFDVLEKNRPDFAIFITDCETPWPAAKASFKTIVVRVGNGAAPAWTKVVDVKI
jgi:predicted metal-dependent peptidase